MSFSSTYAPRLLSLMESNHMMTEATEKEFLPASRSHAFIYSAPRRPRSRFSPFHFHYFPCANCSRRELFSGPRDKSGGSFARRRREVYINMCLIPTIPLGSKTFARCEKTREVKRKKAIQISYNFFSLSLPLRISDWRTAKHQNHTRFDPFFG